MYHADQPLAESRTAATHVTWPGSDLGRPLTARESRLNRDGPRLERRASNVGVPITYLGLSELFTEPRGYSGPNTDWVIGPAKPGDAVIPQEQRTKLAALVAASIDLPLIYVAHEVPKGRLAIASGAGELDGMVRPATLDQDGATRAVGPVPPPAGATATARRMGRRSEYLLAALARALPAAAAIVTAPILLADAVVGALGAGLDPIVFGAVPAGPPAAGQLATWYLLASWDWPVI